MWNVGRNWSRTKKLLVVSGKVLSADLCSGRQLFNKQSKFVKNAIGLAMIQGCRDIGATDLR